MGLLATAAYAAPVAVAYATAASAAPASRCGKELGIFLVDVDLKIVISQSENTLN